MPIGTIETIVQVLLKLVYGRADELASFLHRQPVLLVLNTASGRIDYVTKIIR